MKILGREVRWSEPRLQTRSDLAQITVNDLGIAFLTKMAEVAGRSGETIPAVYRAIQFISDTVASLHLEEIERGRVSPPSRILTAPNPAETYQDTINAIVNSLLFRGNAYLIPRTYDDAGFATSLIVAHPDEVKCQWDTRKIYPVYEWRDRLMEAGRDIIPIPLNRWPGRPDGVSPISACRLMLEGAYAEQQLATNLMLDDSTPTGALSFPEKMTGTEAKKILEVWEDTHQGRKRPGVLGGGATWTPLSFSPLDAQFLESRTFTVQEIARMFGVHGSILLVPSGDSLTYSTTESLNRGQLTNTISPTYLTKIEQAFSRMLPSGRTARFNTDELLIPDMAVRVQAVADLVKAGFDPAGALEAIGLDPIRHTGGVPSTLQETPVANNGRVPANV